MTPIRIAYSTVDSDQAARQIATTLVEERLAACVNIIPKVTSVYNWKGQVQHESELLLILKTTGERLPALAARLCQIHPYEVPELVAFPVEMGHPEYLNWVVAETE